MNNRIKEAKKLEIDKYYKLGDFKFIKVEYEFNGEKIGTSINIIDWIVLYRLS